MAIRKFGIADHAVSSNASAGASVYKSMDEAMAATAECAVRLEKRLRNGPEDNVWHYFQLTVQKLDAQ
jgi:hypothetical protein